MSVMTEEEMDYQIELLEELCNNESDSAENLYEFSESELSAHDAQTRADERVKVLDEYKEEVLSRFCECCDQYACDGAMIGSIQECATICMLRDVCTDIANELKEQK